MDKTSSQNARRVRRKPRYTNISSVIVAILILAASIGIFFYFYHSVPSSTLKKFGVRSVPESSLSNQSAPDQTVILSQSDLNSASPVSSPTTVGTSGPEQNSPPRHKESIKIKVDTSSSLAASVIEKTPSIPGASSPPSHATVQRPADSGVQPEGSDAVQQEQSMTLVQASPISPQDLVDKLNVFYTKLDSRPYMAAFQLEKSSKVHFSQLIQKLLNHPPVVARETDNLFTLLKNTAHFFRILGKDNVLLLKGILDREHDELESIMDTFYRLTAYPDIIASEYGIQLREDELVDYCGFFLSTMGGRLYLFRRDSTSRMVVTYYAIKVLDRANRNGNNKLGIDLLPPVRNLIEEMENGGRNIKRRNEYLETLYGIEEYYESKVL